MKMKRVNEKENLMFVNHLNYYFSEIVCAM